MVLVRHFLKKFKKSDNKEGKVRLLRPSFKLVYREKEEVYKTKKEALDK